LAVATALREQHKGKVIVIAGDDDHRLETNPGRTKALEAAAAIERASVARELHAAGMLLRRGIGRVSVEKARIFAMMQEALRAVAALSGKDVFVVAPSSSGVEISKQQGFATLDSCVKNLAHN
jgi:hypothetical protein